MEERVSYRGARSSHLLMLRELRNPPKMAFAPLGVLVRIDHYQSYRRVSVVRDWLVIDHNLESECRRVTPSTLLDRMEVVARHSPDE